MVRGPVTSVPRAGRVVLGKQLRLQASALTDIGRRRERNQDSTAHLVPKDEQSLAEKGALFVVCDGMGGYAAGEVASELATKAIRDTYFASDESNIISRIAGAISEANHAVFSYAQEHPETAGMGTTCVVLVLQGGRAFFVNIGDSRAYLIRDGRMRQVTQDHSWVAEQVRAGVLSEESARTHPHRNVITRSLGTQPNVSADLFIETIQDGDRALLCSDGLHGYVEEQVIEQTLLDHADPDHGTQHLIDLANENGGPDNISAIIVHMLEVPPISAELDIPDGQSEKQINTQPMPAVAAPRRGGRTRPSNKKPNTAASADKLASHSSSRRATNAVLTLLALLLVGVLAAGFWDYNYGPYASARTATAQLNGDVAAAQQAIQQANGQDPASALAALATARERLLSDLTDPQVDPQSVQNAQAVLDGPLAAAVQAALQQYNRNAVIMPLSLGSVVTHTGVTCADPAASNATVPLDTPSALVAAAAPRGTLAGTQLLYALTAGAGSLYQLGVPLDATGHPVSGTVICIAQHLPNVARTVAITLEGTTLYALTQQSGGAFEVLTLVPNGFGAAGLPNLKVASRFTLKTPNGEHPNLLAAQGDTAFVAYQAGTSGAPGVWLFRSNPGRGPAATVALPQPAVSVAATGGALYGLLGDGTLGQLGAGNAWQQLGVQVQSPLSPDDPALYQSGTPVPTVPTGDSASTGSGTLFPASAALITDPALPSHVLLNDGAHNRVIRLVATSGGPGLGYSMQYVYSLPLSNLAPLAVSSNGTTLAVFGWSNGNLIALPIDEPKA